MLADLWAYVRRVWWESSADVYRANPPPKGWTKDLAEWLNMDPSKWEPGNTDATDD